MFASFRKLLCVAALGCAAMGNMMIEAQPARADQTFNGNQVIPFQTSGRLPPFANGTWIWFHIPQGNGRFGPIQYMGPFYGNPPAGVQESYDFLVKAGCSGVGYGPVR